MSYGRKQKRNYTAHFFPCQACFRKKLGGDGGIRTLDTSFSPYAPLAGEVIYLLKPCCHNDFGADYMLEIVFRHLSVTYQIFTGT